VTSDRTIFNANEPRALSCGAWQLTGRFWAFSLEKLPDFLFRARFEDEGG